jgi:hypothetical protein
MQNRVPDGLGAMPDGLDLTIEDYHTLGLHPATLPALFRVTTESSFWDANKETFRKTINTLIGSSTNW